MTTQEKKTVEKMKFALLHLATYAYSHPIDEKTGQNVDALVAVGALSPQDAAFITGAGIEFHGFNSSLIGKNTPVLEMDSTTYHFVGTSAGSVLVNRKQDEEISFSQ
jgi:hypothetical protein